MFAISAVVVGVCWGFNAVGEWAYNAYGDAGAAVVIALGCAIPLAGCITYFEVT